MGQSGVENRTSEPYFSGRRDGSTYSIKGRSVYRRNLRNKVNDYFENFGRALSRAINYAKKLKDVGLLIVEMQDVMNKRLLLIEGA